MSLMTEILGEIEYDPEVVIRFEEGLYGFKEFQTFILINVEETELPFQWLQSTQDGELSFFVTSPFAFCETYDFEIPDDITKQMGIENLDDLLILSLVVLNEDLAETSINLKAPLIFNTKLKTGKQIILNEDYPYKYKIFNKEG